MERTCWWRLLQDLLSAALAEPLQGPGTLDQADVLVLSVAAILSTPHLAQLKLLTYSENHLTLDFYLL